MRKLLKLAFVAYLGLAVAGLVRERNGELVCNCADDCWCKQPGLNLFRWVFPFGHRER